MRNKGFRWILSLLLVSAFICRMLVTHAEDDIPISLVITVPSDVKLETAGTLDSLVFTISNESDNPYTLYHAKLSGGFDNELRALNDIITVDAYSTREFSLSDISISDEQLDQDIVYVLSWDELVNKDSYEINTEYPDIENETSDSEIKTGIDSDTEEFDSLTGEGEAGSDKNSEDDPSFNSEDNSNEFISRSIEASVRLDRFVPPVLGVSVISSSSSATEGDTFSITYSISNDTKYDMSGIMLTDAGVYDGAIPIPKTELMAGDSITVTIDYVMGNQDMVFHPIVSYVALQKQFESRPDEPVIIDSIVTGIKIDVEQYPSNVEGSTFAITVTNIGNRMLTGLQLYDEINTEIDIPFDLSPQQQRIVTFNVPSAYSSGLIRRVRFRITGYDYYGDPFSYTDVNSYECIPYITSDEVRLSVLASLRNAYYDEDGKLCGEILLEIRNYSDVRLTSAVLSELTLFGPLETYRELLRGETYYSSVFQLDGIDGLQFCVTASDSTGQTYNSDIVLLNLEQLASLASKPEGQKIVYHSNTFLSELTSKVAANFRNAFLAALVLIILSMIICLVLWFLEERLKARLPSDSLINIVVPESKTPKTSMDQILNSSPAEQLGYTVPTKIRYGATTIKTSSNDPSKTKRYGADQLLNRHISVLNSEHRHNYQMRNRGVRSIRDDSDSSDIPVYSGGPELQKIAGHSVQGYEDEIPQNTPSEAKVDSYFYDSSPNERQTEDAQSDLYCSESSIQEISDVREMNNINLDQVDRFISDTPNTQENTVGAIHDSEQVHPDTIEILSDYSEASETNDSFKTNREAIVSKDSKLSDGVMNDINIVAQNIEERCEDPDSFDDDHKNKYEETDINHIADHSIRILDFYSSKKKKQFELNSVIRMKNRRNE